MDCNGIVESLRKEFLLRTHKELEQKKSQISESYNSRNSYYSGAHINAIVKSEVEHKQQLIDHLIKTLENDFPNKSFADFEDAILSVVKQEYDKVVPFIEDFARGISRGGSTVHYKKQIVDAKERALGIVQARFDILKAKNSVNKNVVFISHAKEDAYIAEAVKTQIDKVFGNGLNVFVSSIPGVIEPGSDWFDRIIANLKENSAFIVLMTPCSKARPFVWFEIGFSWVRRLGKTCQIYALCAPPINPGDLPEPLCRLQAISLAEEDQTKAFFSNLIKKFNLGNLDTLEFDKIRESLPEYLNKNTPESATINIHNDTYADYSDEELKQVLIDILSKERKYHLDPVTHSTVFDGELIDFREFDQNHELPSGTSKKFLKELGEKFQLELESESENTIRFKKQTEFWIGGR